MRSIKIKLMSLIAMICLVMGIMIVGIFSAQTQQIKLNGQVNFEIGDKRLYVKDVRLQENTDSSPYSLSEQGRFLPGYINGNFNMNLGSFTNTYGSFALYFDIINTMDETTEETFSYTVKPSTTQSGVTVSSVILDSNGSTVSQIPQGTVKPSEVTSLTPISATIKVTVSSTAGVSVNLNNITITINQYVPQVYDYFTFEVNSDGTTVTLTDYDSSLSDTTDIAIPATVSVVDGVWMDGNDYTVTAIASASPSSDGVFSNSGITSIELPSTLEMIGNYAFYGCTGLTSITLPSSLNIIGEYAFALCSGLTEVDLSNYASLTSIGDEAFSWCSGLTSIDLSNCTSLTSIGHGAFYNCSGLTEVDLSNCISLENIGLEVFCYCSSLATIDLSDCISLISIEQFAFRYCSALTNIILTNCVSLENIGVAAFHLCTSLERIDFDTCVNLSVISPSAFDECYSLRSIILPYPYEWYITDDESSIYGELLDMSDPEQNAELLTETYNNYYFKRNA